MSGEPSGGVDRVARSLGAVIRDVGLAVATGQQQLDEHSLKTRGGIERDVEEGKIPYAIDTPWYRFSEVEVDMKLFFDTETRLERVRDPELDDQVYLRHHLVASSPSPPEAGQPSGDLSMASSVRFSIIPVPPEVGWRRHPEPERDDDRTAERGEPPESEETRETADDDSDTESGSETSTGSA